MMFYLTISNEMLMKLQSGHVLEPLDQEEMAKMNKNWEGYPYGLVRLNPGRWLFPSKYKNFADAIFNFEFRSNDVVIMTYPKCGTTWTQEIVWTMKNNPNLDDPRGNTFILQRSPFLDMDMLLHEPAGPPTEDDTLFNAFKELCPGKNPADGFMLQMAAAMPDPRVIKTHLPFSLLSPSALDTTKVVYTARNPKDVIVSYHHHCRINTAQAFVGTFEEFVQYFVEDDVLYGPYWLHMKEAWEKKDHPNLHIIFYEDMKANPIGELRKLNDFLNTNLTETQLENIAKYTNFNIMKARMKASGFKEENLPMFKKEIVKKDGGFFRKGESGDWKGKLTPEMTAKVDQWTQRNMTSFGINFKYGI